MSGSSELWKYFKKIKKADCDLCEKKKKTCTYTDESDLKRHLRKHHEDTYNKLWPPTEIRSSQQYHQSNISIPSTSTRTTNITIQNRGPYAGAVDDEGPRSNKRQKSMDSYSDRNNSNEQEENINLSSARRPMDAHHSIPSTSTRTTSTTIQNRRPYACVVDDEGPRTNKRQKSMDSYPDRNISNEQEENINLSSARRPTDNHSIPSTSTRTTSTTIQNRRPYACVVDDEGPRSNKRQKSMDSYPDRNISNEQKENINLSSARRPMDDHHSIPSTSTRTTSTTIQNRGPYVAIEKPASNNKISDVKKQLLKVKISGLVGNYSSDEILRYLKDQTDIFSEVSRLKVLEPWPTKNNPKIHQAIIELDAATYVSVMDRGKLSVDFNTCLVYDSNNIRFCHRCSGFDHFQQNCSNKVTCPKCAGEHTSSYCSSSVRKCINCTNANLTDNSHAAWDALKCPIFKKKLD